MAATCQCRLDALVGPIGGLGFRLHYNPKRKSAVELLAESKSLYVKSCAVLDTKQDLKAQNQPPTQNRSESCEVQRRVSGCEGLATKLRKLIGGESRDSDEAPSRLGHCKSLPDLTNGEAARASRCFPSSVIGADGDSPCETSQEPESDSTSASYGQPPSPSKSSVSLGGSASKAEIRKKRSEWELRGIVRSKSDVGQLPVAKAVPVSPHALPEPLVEFFQYLGLTSAEYRTLTEAGSRSSSPVFLSSSSSCSADSTCRSPRLAVLDRSPETARKMPSIVESNARVIKWLCHCSRS